jgi:endoglucanase
MTQIKSISKLVLLFVIVMISCNEKEMNVVVSEEKASINSIEFEYNGSIFNTQISDNKIIVDRLLPYGATKVVIRSLSLAENCSSNFKAGDIFNLTSTSTPSMPFIIAPILITNNNSKKTAAYEVQFNTRKYISVVEQYGLLQTSGNKIVDKNKNPVSLAGNSFYWSNNGWGGENYYKPEIVSWLALDWGTSIVRASMGVDDIGGYLQDKNGNIAKVKVIVDAAIANGLYVIIDWHTENAHKYPDEAVEFFTQMALLYGKNDHIIYEIFNEPLEISWSNTIKPYAEKVITAIRKIDPDNLIVVGTPTWSQRVDMAAADPITISTNIAYTLHFYTVFHKQGLRDIATAALNKGLPIFVTEWGPIGYTQNDPEADLWMKWCKANMISHCAWAVNDKLEEWSIVKPGTYKLNNLYYNESKGDTLSIKIRTFWADSSLTETGKLERKYIRSWMK